MTEQRLTALKEVAKIEKSLALRKIQNNFRLTFSPLIQLLEEANVGNTVIDLIEEFKDEMEERLNVAKTEALTKVQKELA